MSLNKTFSTFLAVPYIYNLRRLIAGNQKLTKDFITNYYQKYNCGSVLDIGCGTGDFAPIFSTDEYLGIDINPSYISYARRRYTHKFSCADITKLNVLPQKYDAVILVSTLHHLSQEEIGVIFPVITLSTRKIIVIVDLNPETHAFKKMLIDLDRGKYIRTTEEKKNLLNQYGRIVVLENFSTGLASQTGIVLLPNQNG